VKKIIDALLEAEDDVGLESLLKQIGVRFFKPNRRKPPDLIKSNDEIIQWMIDVDFFPPVSNCVCLEKSCLKKFKSPIELSKHIRKIHDHTKLNLPMSLFEQIIGFEFKWGWKPFLQHVNPTLLTEENRKCKVIGNVGGEHLMKCPFPKCRRLFLDQAQMNNHISKDHMKVIPSGWKKVNSFWLILRRFAEMSRFSTSMKFIISDVDAFKCDECDFVSTSSQGAKLHRTNKYQNIDSITNEERPVFDGHLAPIFHDTEQIYSDFSNLNSDSSKVNSDASRSNSENSRITSDGDERIHSNSNEMPEAEPMKQENAEQDAQSDLN
jgi:uncharacterized C2H2 Zn-finger protein